MISPLMSHLLVPFIIAMFLAINMGGSGTGPAFSAALWSKCYPKESYPRLIWFDGYF